mmetsp:Transcript_116015/g.369075  ORF Transcript_116015/g.369075 Transcript_116015/m.369075 type:complete len:386 (+) Transcript_116015:157-1314(+)
MLPSTRSNPLGWVVVLILALLGDAPRKNGLFLDLDGVDGRRRSRLRAEPPPLLLLGHRRGRRGVGCEAGPLPIRLCLFLRTHLHLVGMPIFPEDHRRPGESLLPRVRHMDLWAAEDETRDIRLDTDLVLRPLPDPRGVCPDLRHAIARALDQASGVHAGDPALLDLLLQFVQTFAQHDLQAEGMLAVEETPGVQLLKMEQVSPRSRKHLVEAEDEAGKAGNAREVLHDPLVALDVSIQALHLRAGAAVAQAPDEGRGRPRGPVAVVKRALAALRLDDQVLQDKGLERIEGGFFGILTRCQISRHGPLQLIGILFVAQEERDPGGMRLVVRQVPRLVGCVHQPSQRPGADDTAFVHLVIFPSHRVEQCGEHLVDCLRVLDDLRCEG